MFYKFHDIYRVSELDALPVALARLRHASRRRSGYVREPGDRKANSLVGVCSRPKEGREFSARAMRCSRTRRARLWRSRPPIAFRCCWSMRTSGPWLGAAGWRGTAAGIVAAAVAQMRRRFGAEPGNLHAAIGPGIGKCCYEVGPDVAAQFGEQGRAHIDLAAENQQHSPNAGVTPGRIYASNLCTRCMPEEFHSFRRDKDASGRLYSFAGILPPGSAVQ